MPPVVALVLFAAPPAQAHLFGEGGAGFSWLDLDPLAISLLVLTAWLYFRGSAHTIASTNRNADGARRRRRYFWTGWSALLLVLATPLDALGEELFSAHMLQHEVLMLVAAPLLVLSRPSSTLLRGAPAWAGRSLGLLVRGGGRIWRWLCAPFTAWTLHLLGLWAWHLPALFSAGLRHTGVHALQHASFLLIALLFWWSLLRGAARDNAGLGVLYLFTTAVHAGLLGALLTFSPRPWYAPYVDSAPAWGFSALEDQQLGGLIMWVPGCAVFIAGALMLLARSLVRGSERSAHSFGDRRLHPPLKPGDDESLNAWGIYSEQQCHSRLSSRGPGLRHAGAGLTAGSPSPGTQQTGGQ